VTMVLSDEHLEMAAVVRRLLRNDVPLTSLPMLADSSDEPWRKIWKRMTDQLGLPGLCVPERLGGGGHDHAVLAVACEELGAALAPVPFFSSVVLGTGALLLVDDVDANERWLPALAAGSRVVALAGAWDGRGLWRPEQTSVRTVQSDSVTLVGRAEKVLGAREADLLVVIARDEGQGEGGLGLFVVDDLSTVARTDLAVLDPTRSRADLEFMGTPATRLVTHQPPRLLLDELRDRAFAALAAEQYGGMQASLRELLDYLRVRVQFGRVVASFQALKHRLAELQMQLEEAEALARHVNALVDSSPDGLAVAAAETQARLGALYSDFAQECLLLHGGIGFTWEHHAHLFLKRAKADKTLFDTPAGHRLRLGQLLGLG